MTRALQTCLPLLVLLGTGCASQSELTPEALQLREMCLELRRTLFEDPVVRSFMVYPTCREGRITLLGSVRDYDGYLEAERIARSMPGITEVQNYLEILEEDSFTPRTRP